MQYCPKSVKTTFKRIFLRTMLSGGSWATLYKVLTCAMLSQEYQGKTEQDFYLCNVVTRVLRQY